MLGFLVSIMGDSMDSLWEMREKEALYDKKEGGKKEGRRGYYIVKPSMAHVGNPDSKKRQAKKKKRNN